MIEKTILFENSRGYCVDVGDMLHVINYNTCDITRYECLEDALNDETFFGSMIEWNDEYSTYLFDFLEDFYGFVVKNCEYYITSYDIDRDITYNFKIDVHNTKTLKELYTNIIKSNYKLLEG